MISEKFYDIPMLSSLVAVLFTIRPIYGNFFYLLFDPNFPSEFVIAFPSPFKDYLSLGPFLNVLSFAILLIFNELSFKEFYLSIIPDIPSHPFPIFFIVIPKTIILILLVPTNKDTFSLFDEFVIENFAIAWIGGSIRILDLIFFILEFDDNIVISKNMSFHKLVIGPLTFQHFVTVFIEQTSIDFDYLVLVFGNFALESCFILENYEAWLTHLTLDNLTVE